MNIAQQITQARAQHLPLLVDRVQVQRPTSQDSANEYKARETVWVADGDPVPALVQASQSLVDAAADPGVDDLKVEPYSVKVPVGTDVQNGDRLEVTACELLPALVGETLAVQTVQASSVAVVTRIRAAHVTPARIRP